MIVLPSCYEDPCFYDFWHCASLYHPSFDFCTSFTHVRQGSSLLEIGYYFLVNPCNGHNNYYVCIPWN